MSSGRSEGDFWSILAEQFPVIQPAGGGVGRRVAEIETGVEAGTRRPPDGFHPAEADGDDPAQIAEKITQTVVLP